MSQAHNSFEQYELEYDLFDIRIDGVPIWERIRFQVFRKIERQAGLGQAHTAVARDWHEYLRGARLVLKNLVFKNPYFADESDVLYVGHQRRKKQDDGSWWDIYCDPLHAACDHEYVHFEIPHLLGHLRPAKTANLRYLDLIEYTGTFQRLLGLNSPVIPDVTQKTLDAASEAIEERFNTDVDLEAMARHSLHVRRTTLPLYRALIKRVNPELAVVVVSYGREVFIEACQEEGVPVVELQHGVIYTHHYGYSFPGPRTKEMFPDYLLAFGDFWTESVEFPIPDERVIPVGYPFLEASITEYADIESTNQLLFISQGTIGEQLSKFAIEVNQHPEFEYDIIYKLHPGEYDRWEDEYPWLRDANFEIVDTPDRQLYRLFAESRAQIGVGSTAIYEGLAFGLTTLVYDCPGSEVLQPLVDEKSATQVVSPGDVVDALNDEQAQFNRDYYFERDATKNICKTLENLRESPSR